MTERRTAEQALTEGLLLILDNDQDLCNAYRDVIRAAGVPDEGDQVKLDPPLVVEGTTHIWAMLDEDISETKPEELAYVRVWDGPGKYRRPSTIRQHIQPSASKAADALKEFIEELIEAHHPAVFAGSSVTAELITTALAYVDWMQIARRATEKDAEQAAYEARQ